MELREVTVGESVEEAVGGAQHDGDFADEAFGCWCSAGSSSSFRVVLVMSTYRVLNSWLCVGVEGWGGGGGGGGYMWERQVGESDQYMLV